MSAQQSENNEPTAMDLANEAVSQLVEEIQGDGSIMTTAVVFYEVQHIDEDGNVEYLVSYTSITDASMSSVVGTATLGIDTLMHAVTGDDE